MFARRYRQSWPRLCLEPVAKHARKTNSAKRYKQLHARPEADIRQEATVLEPFAACQHLFVGFLAVRGISKCVASSFGR